MLVKKDVLLRRANIIKNICENLSYKPVVSHIFRVDLFVSFLPHVLLKNVSGFESFLAINAGLKNKN